MKTLLLIMLTLLTDAVPGGKTYLRQLQERDSILIADQLEYGFVLEGVNEGTALALPDLSPLDGDTLALVRSWRLDTLRTGRKTAPDIRASVIIAPFEKGEYSLPPLSVQRTVGSKTDTIVFEPSQMTVTAMPIDTATFVIRDIKGQMKYPVRFGEVLPYISGILLLAGLVYALAVYLKRRRGGAASDRPKDPPYIVALRKLEHYRGDKHWAPDRQKAFYSGVTDILKEYIGARFGVDAPEMTTAELFGALKGEKAISPEMYSDLKDLFERADFVKFAKMIASEGENAGVLPLSVKFVTDTHEKLSETEQEAPKG